MSKAYAATHGFVADGGGLVGLGWSANFLLRRVIGESPKKEVGVFGNRLMVHLLSVE